LLQATAPVKLQVEEALNKGVGSFQELLQQQKDALQSLQQDYSSYTELACLHPSVVMAQRESTISSREEAKERALRSTPGIMRQVTCDET
jgi:hypothetical protein